MKKCYVLLSYMLLAQLVIAQDAFVQNIKGQVIEQTTGLGLIGANVFIIDSDPVIGTSTDENGYYRFDNLPVGRYRLACSYIGYLDVQTRSILITTGKEVVQDFNLEEDLNEINVEIVAITDRDKTEQLDNISTKVFNSALASRYAGSRSDVARMAAGFAGVLANDDARNDIVIRGNTPSGLLWRLNDVDIPNPSHFGALGATGGPVSMLNNNLLTNSTFMTGAFPSMYGNALSGVFDLTMRKGNRDKLEGMFGISFNGFEGGLEGPLGKKGGSYLVNYRYSVIDLISKLGGDSSGATGTGDAIPRYQDLSFHFNLPTEKFGSFSLFGLRGNSGIDFISDITSSDNPNLFSDSNQNLYYNSAMEVYGLSNKHYFSNQSYGKVNLSFSRASVNTIVDTISNDFTATPVYRDDSSQDRASLGYQFRSKLNRNHSLVIGATMNNLNFNFIDSVRTVDNDFRTLRDFDGDAILSQAYAQWLYKFNTNLSFNLGVYGQQFSFNDSYAIEPRLKVKYNFNPKLSINFGAARHSKLQDYQLYLVKTRLADGSYVETNRDLMMTKNDQLIAGVSWAFAKKWSLKSEVYYQSLSDVPVEQFAPSFSALNIGADFNTPSQDSLVNNGTGNNIGTEITLERTFENGFYTLSTISLFKSTYKGSDGVKRSTAFDNGYVANVLTGKEFKLGKKYSLAIDTKLTMAGGKRYVPIDLEASILAGEVAYQTEVAYENQFDDYFRTDLKFTIRQNSKKLSQFWSFDLQNLFNNENVFGESFDVRNSEIDITTQLGFYPVIEYRLEF